MTLPVISTASDPAVNSAGSTGTRPAAHYSQAKAGVTPLALLCSLLVLPHLATAQTPPVRIMPLGDSITWGSAGGYRNKLYQTLTAAGYNLDYVGTLTGGGVATLPDSDHEGHGGFSIGEIDAGITNWLDAVADPDVILLHIGTNDFGKNITPLSEAINRLDALITKLVTLRPYAHIIVTNLLERGEPYNTSIQTLFNPFVQAKVNAQAALGRRVTFLDMRSAVPLSETVDQLHPNQTGYDHMADAWLPAIQAVIGTQGDSSAPGLVRALAKSDNTHVALTFSKPVADAAATLGNFALSGGLTIAAAALDASKRVVTLTTSPQALVGSYTVTVNGVVDRTAGVLALPANSTAVFNAFDATALTIGNPGFNDNFPFDSLITTDPATGLGAPWFRAAADWVDISYNAWMNPANTDRGQLLSMGGAASQVMSDRYAVGIYRLSADLATSFNDNGTAVLSLVDASTNAVLATQAWHYGPGQAGGDQYHWAYDQGLSLTVAAGNPALGHPIKIVLSGGSGYSEYDNIALHFNPPATAIAIGNAGFNNDWGTDALITTDPAAGFGAPWCRAAPDWVDIAPSAWMNPANTDRGQLLSQGAPAYQVLAATYAAGTYRLSADVATSFNTVAGWGTSATAKLSLVDAVSGNVLATKEWNFVTGPGSDQFHWAYDQGVELTVAAGDPAIGHPIKIVIAGGTGLSEYDNVALNFVSGFDSWVTSSSGLSGADAAFDADPDKDGIPNGIEFVIGGQPNPARGGSNSSALLPTVASAGNNLVFTYTRMNEAAYLNPLVEFNTGLSGTWTTAVNGVNATIVVTPGATAAAVTVTIPKGAAQQMFARLKVIRP